MLRLSILGLVVSATLVVAAEAPRTVTVSVTKAYVPVGFDDNDRVQIAVAGTFNNTCYRVGPHALKVDSAKKTIDVQQQAYHYGGVCLQMFVPFNQVIDVGIIPAGDYQIRDSVSGKELGKLAVTQGANVGPDDFLYAPLNDAYVIYDEEAKRNVLVLAGTFGDRCSEISEVKTNVQNEVIIVQPVVNRATDVACPPAKVRFLKTVELPESVSPGVYLLHVRALNGQAINKVVDLENSP